MEIIEKIINKVEELLSKDKYTFNVPELLEFLYSLKAEDKETPNNSTKQWEYLVKDGYEVPLDKWLNELGKEGWELASFSQHRDGYGLIHMRAIFKRENQQ